MLIIGFHPRSSPFEAVAFDSLSATNFPLRPCIPCFRPALVNKCFFSSVSPKSPTPQWYTSLFHQQFTLGNSNSFFHNYHYLLRNDHSPFPSKNFLPSAGLKLLILRRLDISWTSWDVHRISSMTSYQTITTQL